MKIHFINRYFAPDHSATSQILSDLCFDLARDGTDEICVVTSRQRYDDAAAQLPAFETIDGVQVRRMRTTTFGRAWLPGRAIDYLTFYLCVAGHLLLRLQRGDVVVAKTDPPLIGLVAAAVAKLRGARVVHWSQDLYPEVAQVLGIRLFHGTLGRWVTRLRNAALRAADANVVLGERMAHRLRAAGVAQERISIMPNWADGELVHPVAPSDNVLRGEWGVQGKFVVGYSGNLGRAHEVSTMLGAMEALRGEPDVVFLYIGAGAQLEGVKREAARRGLHNVMFQPYQPREQLALSLSVPDVHLVSLNPEMEGLIVPSKFYGICAAGRPCVFIGDTEGEIALMLRRFQIGASVSVNDAPGLAAALRTLHHDENARLEMGQRARRVFLQHYDKPVAMNAWRDLLAALSVEKLSLARDVEKPS